MRYQPIPSQLFSDRRNSFGKKMNRHAIAVFYSNEAMPKSGDQNYPFRQDSSLFALSGLDQPGTILVLNPWATSVNMKELVFILPQDPDNTTWNGERLTVNQARKISGVRSVYSIDQWEKVMSPLLRKAKTIYLNTDLKEDDQQDALLLNDRMFKVLKRKYSDQSFLSAKKILNQILMVKHPLELELMKKAINVTNQAFRRVLKTIKPGLREYEVEAELTYSISGNGCRHAFEPIVASGQSACTLHYIKNDGLIKRDDLVLIDFGAEYACMSSDMTRTVPASGIFTKRQKQIYQSVLRLLEEITSIMRPGITLKELNTETGKRIERELLKLKIITKHDLKTQDAENPIARKYFMHGVSHHLGYDVHDQSERSVPLKAGMVLTCEPGLYIPEEKIGIRLENDILITRGTPKNLMADVPIDPDEIEDLMSEARRQK